MPLTPRPSRSRTFLKAVIRFQNGNFTVDCTVRDLSEGGARLDVDEAIALPAEFELDIPQKQGSRSCELKWRHTREVGVAFVLAGAVRSVETPEERIAQLEHENAALKREIARLREALEGTDSV